MITTTTTTRPTPEALWRSGAGLTAAELSSLLEDCTGWTVERVTHEGEPAFYLRDPYGDRDADGFPWFDLEDVMHHVAEAIDEALA
jgi:hypothetical protein